MKSHINLVSRGRSGSSLLREDDLHAGQVFPNEDVLWGVWGIVEQYDSNTGLEGLLRKNNEGLRGITEKSSNMK